MVQQLHVQIGLTYYIDELSLFTCYRYEFILASRRKNTDDVRVLKLNPSTNKFKMLKLIIFNLKKSGQLLFENMKNTKTLSEKKTRRH